MISSRISQPSDPSQVISAASSESHKPCRHMYIPLCKHVVGSKIIPLNPQILITSSLIFSRLFFNVCTWSDLTRSQLGVFNTFFLKVLRRLFKNDFHNPTDDKTILESMNIPTPLKSLLASLEGFTSSWYSLIRSDLNWLLSTSPSLACFNQSDLNSESFLKICMSPKWKSIVHKTVFDNPGSFEIASQSSCKSSNPVPCPECNLMMINSHQLAGHLYRVHKRSHPARRYATSSGACCACLKVFHNRPRHIHHLRQCSPICLKYYMYFHTPHADSVLQSLDAEDRVQNLKARHSGVSKLHAAIPVVLRSGPKRPFDPNWLNSEFSHDMTSM